MEAAGAKESLQVPKEKSRRFSQLAHLNSIIYESYALRGIRIDRVEPGFVSSSFKVPALLIDRYGNMASAAVASLVDVIGGALIYVEGLPDELEISSKLLGSIGGYTGTAVTLKNKLSGELIAQGRHSLYGKHSSKL